MRQPPIRQTSSLLALSVLGMATVGPLGWPLARNGDDTTAFPDPIPIQRVQIPPERLPIELKRLESGVLVQMPRLAFEVRVQRAAREADAARNPPRLVEARYRARLEGSSLTGTGQWRILAPEPGPSILSISSLGLALRHVRVQSGQEAIADAIVGDVDGKRPGLLLEHGGPQSVFFDWSARGESANRGLRFDLTVPPAIVGSLELKLPASPPALVETESPALVSGPRPAETPDWQRWHIRFNNQSQVRFVVRQGSKAEQAPMLVRAALQTRLDVTFDAVRAEYQYQIQASREGVRELQFSGSPELQPLEVDAPDLETWEIVPAKKPGGPVGITLRMRKPLRGGLVTIRCQLPLPLQAQWPLPSLQLAGSIDRGESIQLRLMSDMRLEDWQSGAFRIVGSSVEPTGIQVLKLERSGPATASSARPSARVHHRGPEVRARSAIWWQMAAPTSALAVQMKYDVARGKVFQLPLAIPAGWQVEQVTLTPAELLRGWNTDRDGSQTRLAIDLQRGLGPTEGTGTASASAQLLVKLRPESTQASFLQRIEFPQVVPSGATLQESVLGISVGTTLDATVETRAPPASSADKGPWGRQTLSYGFRESDGPVRGILNTRPKSTRLRTRCTTDVIMISDRAHVQARVTVQPDGHSPDSVVVAWSAPTGGVREWKIRRGNNRIARVARLHGAEAAWPLSALAARHILNAVSLVPFRAHPPELYRVSFIQPVRDTVTLEGLCDVVADDGRNGASVRQWCLPLVTAIGSASQENELQLFLPAGIEMADTPGLQPLPQKPANGSLPFRRFRYGAPAPEAIVRGAKAGFATRPDAIVADACLRTIVRPNSALLHEYRFALRRWSPQTLPVRLPAGAKFVSAWIDGHGIPNAGNINEDDEGLPLALPVPAGPQKHELAILYTTPLPSWRAWIHIEPPTSTSSTALPWAPEVPVRPLNYRHLWSFPTGVQPIEVNALHQAFSARAENPLNPLPSWIRRGLSFDAAASDESASRSFLTSSQLVETIHARLAQRTKVNGDRLDDLLRELATDPRLRVSSLVIDNRTLANAGINADTVVTHQGNDEIASLRDGWDQLRLAVVALDGHFVITTTNAAAAWQEPAGDSMPTEIAEAIRVAANQGSDGSGRFSHLATWLNDEDTGPAMANGTRATKRVPLFADFDHSEWESTTADSGASFTLVNEHAPNLVGLGLAILSLAASWVLRGFAIWARLLALGAWLLVTGLGMLWLPPALRTTALWPALAAGGVAAIWYVAALARTQRVRVAKPSTVTATLLVLFGSMALFSRAAGPGAAVVWLVGKDDGAQQVLVAPEVLHQLETIARRGTTLSSHAVIVEGDYHGKVSKGQAEFQADFRVYCPTDGMLEVTVPLTGVQLREAFCDGAVAHPRYDTAAVPGGPEAYVVEVKGRGFHSIRMGFTVAVSNKGSLRDVKFGVPEMVASHLIFECPSAAENPEIVAHRGISRMARGAGGSRLEVELGRVSNVHLRWFEESGSKQAAAPRVREGYLWELCPSGSVLTAVLQYSAVNKPIPELELEIPEGLELANVGLARLPGEESEEASPRLRSWFMTGTGRAHRLHLELEHPLISGVQVIVELVPREPFGASAALPVPQPVGALSSEGPGHESFLAYRTMGLDARVDGNGHFGVTGIAAAPFADFWRTARLGDPGADLQVYSFRRVGRSLAPFLRLRFRAPHELSTCVQDVEWKLQRGRADCRLAGQWSAPTESLVLLEWDIPRGLSVTDVSGAELRDWSLTGSRLQVWLDHAVSSATVTVTGSAMLPRQIAKTAGGSPDSSKVTLAAFHAVSAAHTTSFVRIVPSAQIIAEPAQLRNLWPLPLATPLAGEFAYVTDRADHAAVFNVRSNVWRFDVRSLTLAEVIDRSVHLRALVDCHVHQGQLRTLTIRVKNWDNTDLRLEGVDESIHADAVHERGEHTWKLALPPGVSKTLRLQVSSSQPIRGGGSLAMPVVEVSGADHIQQWVAIAGPELQGEDLVGLDPVKDPSRTLAAWPAEAECIRRTGASWAARSPDWHLTAVLRNRAATPGLVKIAGCQQSIANAGNRHWLHETTYGLYHDAGTDLIVRLPAQARLQSATVDDIDVPFAAVPAASYWIRLASTAGVQRVHLTWYFEDGAEAFSHPRVDVPRPNASEPLATTLWTFAVPPEYKVPELPGNKAPMSLGERFLQLAEAQLRLSILAADHLAAGSDALKSSLAATQQRFFHYVSLAALCGDRPAAIDGTLNELKDRNRRTAVAKGYADIRAKAEESSQKRGAAATESTHIQRATDLPLAGTPITWESGALPDDPPAQIRLESIAAEHTRWSWLASLVLASSVLGVWLLAASPSAVTLLQRLWPEQALLLALVLWSLLGGNVLAALFAVIGIVGRLLTTAAWLRGKLRTRAAAPMPSGS